MSTSVKRVIPGRRSEAAAESLGIPDSASVRATMLRDRQLPRAREVQHCETLAASILGRVADAGEVRCIDDFEELVRNAAAALMGSFAAGEFLLHGVVTIDLSACTITDDKDADVVFGDMAPWEV